MERIKEDRPITIKDDKGNLNRCIADIVSVRPLSSPTNLTVSTNRRLILGMCQNKKLSFLWNELVFSFIFLVGDWGSGNVCVSTVSCSSLFLPALHHCDGQAETGDQGHGWGKLKSVTLKQETDLEQLLNGLFCVVPDPARPEGINGNHEQNEQHASRLRGYGQSQPLVSYTGQPS